jgi:hypothetical protein
MWSNVAIGLKRQRMKAFTLFAACGREGGRAKQRPGELTRRTLPPMHRGEFTHPPDLRLGLVDPLYAGRKEGKKDYLTYELLHLSPNKLI